MNKKRFALSLREYVDVRFEAQEKAVQMALAAAKEAVTKSEAANDKRFDSVNEFRSSLSDSARLLMPRIESERMHQATHQNIEELTKRMIKFEEQGRGSHQNWQTIVAVAGVLIPILSLLYYLTKSH
jgi:hypothetical protein